MTAIIGRDRLTWNGLNLYCRGHLDPVATVEPDSTHPGMWRLRLPGGQLSGMLNVTRVKEAAMAATLARLNLQEIALAASPVRSNAPGTTPGPAALAA
jgi:hypothetical protein